jgi:non-ribosomal peptide synthetase component E (peptide arylation enzyme)
MQMLPERRTVGALLAHLAQARPQQDAVVLPPQRLTYAALYAQATAVAGGLWRLGIRTGEPVALLMSNRSEWITVAFGCALIGAPVVALSTWSRRVELEYVLDHSQAVALVTLDRFLRVDYQALLTDIVPEVAQHPPGQIGATRLSALRELTAAVFRHLLEHYSIGRAQDEQTCEGGTHLSMRSGANQEERGHVKLCPLRRRSHGERAALKEERAAQCVNASVTPICGGATPCF